MDDDFRAQYYDWSDATSRTFNLAAINFTDIFERLMFTLEPFNTNVVLP